jgi:hypothetical protein
MIKNKFDVDSMMDEQQVDDKKYKYVVKKQTKVANEDAKEKIGDAKEAGESKEAEDCKLNIFIPKNQFVNALKTINVLIKNGIQIDALIKKMQTIDFFTGLAKQFDFTIPNFIKHLELNSYIDIVDGVVKQSYEKRKYKN